MSDTPNNGHCQQNLRRVVISSLIGAVIEWYDFFLYGVVAGIVFNKIYFPDFDPTVGTVLAFATFAVGFVARPLGGIVFGHFGDKLGRKKMLVLTLEIMGVATVGIGLVPSYDTIGIWAPILLVLCRLAQGIGIGGEWGGAVLMAFESAPPHKRAFYGSLPQVGLALGLMLASGVIGLLSFFLSDEAFLAWGWRVAFILSAILVGVGAYIRISVQETQDFSSAKKKTEQVKYPILAAFKHYPRTLTACVGARFVEGIAFNVFGVFSLTYLTNSCGLDKTVSLFVIVGAAAVMAVAIPFWGMRADTWGRARIFGIAAILLGITAYPTFWVLHNFSHNVLLVFLAIALPFGIIYGAHKLMRQTADKSDRVDQHDGLAAGQLQRAGRRVERGEQHVLCQHARLRQGVHQGAFSRIRISHKRHRNHAVLLTATLDLAAAGTEVAQSDLAPGDVVFFYNDVPGTAQYAGIYLGDNQFIAADNEEKPITIHDLSLPYFQNTYVTARRIAG